MIQRDYLVVGAGTAGVSVCEGIRQHDKRGKITLVGNEVHPPYDRQGLSKRFLSAKDAPVKALLYHPPEWYAQQKIELRLDTMVTQFNLDRRLAVLSNGQTIEFKKACLATGSRPFRPPVAGTSLGNIIYLRSIGDAWRSRKWPLWKEKSSWSAAGSSGSRRRRPCARPSARSRSCRATRRSGASSSTRKRRPG